ncbi:MAG: hypothetical protein GF364_09460 [Candidatus Lokiarchaeota archaeon]|nr:hypothetical protein [Candidatus Lokiarchaeota archaeon]
MKKLKHISLSVLHLFSVKLAVVFISLFISLFILNLIQLVSIPSLNNPINETVSKDSSCKSFIPSVSGDAFSYSHFFTEGYENNLNAYNTTAHHNFSTKGYDLDTAPPYQTGAIIISEMLYQSNYSITNATLTVYADTPTGTSLKIYVTNNYFFTEYIITNESTCEFPVIGKQLAYKIILETSDPDKTPTVKGVAVSCDENTIAIDDECDIHYTETGRGHNAEDKSLGNMTFVYDTTTLKYEVIFDFYMEQIDATHSRLNATIKVMSRTGEFLTWQDNYITYDLNVTINCINYRFFGKKSFNTGIISTGYLGDFELYSIVIQHEECQTIRISSSLDFRCWNNDGGDVSDNTQFSTDLYWNCSKSIDAANLGVVIAISICVCLVKIIKIKNTKKKAEQH